MLFTPSEGRDCMEQDIELLIKRDYPSFNIVTMEQLPESWDNESYLVNGSYVFRFAKKPLLRKLSKEVGVVRALLDHSPYELPKFEYFSKEIQYTGHKILEGMSFASARDMRRLTESEMGFMASDIAVFLRMLPEQVSLPQAKKIGIEYADAWWLNRVKDLLSRKDIMGMCPEVKRILEEFCDLQSICRIDAVIYGDLHMDNVLFYPNGRLKGVFDFGDVAIHDIHQDFYLLYNNGSRKDKSQVWSDLCERVIEHYEMISGLVLNRRLIMLYHCINKIINATGPHGFFELTPDKREILSEVIKVYCSFTE